MGCCHSHDSGDQKKRDSIPPSAGSSLPLELDGCTTRKLHLTVVAGPTDSKSPPFLEEETVKEVIPESANRRPSSSLPSPLTPPPNAAWFPPQPPDLRKPPPSLSEVDRVVGDDEETSEIYSASESLSTSTVPEKMPEGDDWGDHKMLDPCMYSNNTWSTSPSKFQRRSRGGGGGNNSSSTPSPGPNGGGDDSAAYFYSPNSSSRRLEGGMRRSQDPPRRPQLRGVSRPGGRQMGVVPRNAPAAPRPEDKRSGRLRSRSPAMRSGGERHNSSLGRTQNADAGEEDKNPGGGGEAYSLDNPLVSLECFIFL